VIRQLPAGIISREPLTHAHSQDVVEPGVTLGSSFEHRRDTEIAHLRGEPLDERWHVAAKDQDGQAEEGSLSIAFGLPSRPLRRNRNPFFWTAGHPARAGEIRPQPVWAAGVGRVLTSWESPSLCCSFVRTP